MHTWPGDHETLLTSIEAEIASTTRILQKSSIVASRPRRAVRSPVELIGIDRDHFFIEHLFRKLAE